ncbi:MAG: OmpA family protein [Flavobacteriales bacterium]|nr:OmpA family protein [Flavobacteriales bacterium]
MLLAIWSSTGTAQQVELAGVPGKVNGTLLVTDPDVIHFHEMLARFQPLEADHHAPGTLNGVDRSMLFHVVVDIPDANSVRATAILFDPYGTEVSEAYRPWLDHVAALIMEQPTARVRIEAHTDSVGHAPDNLALSDRRARAVKRELVQRGVDQERIMALGMGEQHPVDSNATWEGRHLNRRVELWTIFPVRNRISVLLEAPRQR